MRTVETTGAGIEEAIEKGLKLLDVARENVIVEIIEEAKGGLLGIGSKEAVVRLTTFVPPRSEREKFVSSTAAEEATKEEAKPESQQGGNYKPRRSSDRRGKNDRRGGGGRDKRGGGGKSSRRGGGKRGPRRESNEPLDLSHIEPKRVSELVADDTQIPDGVKVGAETLGELLDQMGVKNRQIDIEQVISNGEQKVDAPWLLHIKGEKLGMLIGRRGETLAALEYLTRLIASRDIESRAEFSIDVESYRARREVHLSQIAHEKAEEAVRRKKPIFLEPMSPSERRLVHMYLREHPAVFTESQGEGNRRRVSIVPKNDNQA